MCYSHMGTPTLPSPLIRFTAEFGMDSGGTVLLLSPDIKSHNLEKSNSNSSFNNESQLYRRLDS